MALLTTKYLTTYNFNLANFHALTAAAAVHAAQRAKFARKVHKPPLGVDVINFELNGFNVFLWVPWSLSESKVFKFTKYVERNKMLF